MKNYLLLGSALLSALFSSCYTDPFYGGSTVGYGVSNFGGGFNSSVFVSTGDPRWAYDPYRFSYFDRVRSAYYDPFLFGYYPVGYCPVPVRGCPHPYNWSGRGNCPPPQQVRYSNLSRYDNRVSNYQAANYQWARRVSSAGSPQWLNSSERTQLQRRASQPQYAPQPQGSPSWMNGGLRPSSGSSGLRTSPPAFGNPGFSFDGGRSSSRSQISRSVPPTAIQRSSPSIEPRSARGGMFDGINRSSGGRAAAPAPMPASTRVAPERPSRPSRSESRKDDSDNSGGLNGGSSGGSSGGLRRFQR